MDGTLVAALQARGGDCLQHRMKEIAMPDSFKSAISLCPYIWFSIRRFAVCVPRCGNCLRTKSPLHLSWSSFTDEAP